MICLIAAVDRKLGIAKQGILPWSIPSDEKYFTKQTQLYGGNVLSGGTTFKDSYRCKPLKDRKNFVLTNRKDKYDRVTLVSNLDDFLLKYNGSNNLWVAGGASVFDQIIKKGLADKIYLTHIDADFKCDQFFPAIPTYYELSYKSEIYEENGFSFFYSQYEC